MTHRSIQMRKILRIGTWNAQSMLQLGKDHILDTELQVMRKEGEYLKKEIMLGTTPGARKQGTPRMRWMNNMEEWTGMSFKDLLKNTRDRRKWSRLVHESTNPWIEDS